MDVRDHSTPGDGGLDQRVELLVTADRELEMARRDTLHLKVLAGVPGELEDLGREVLQYCRRVDRGRCTDPLALLDRVLEETVDTTDGELSGAGIAVRFIRVCGEGGRGRENAVGYILFYHRPRVYRS